MTAKIGGAATAKVIGRLTGSAGMNSSIAALTEGNAMVSALNVAQVRAQNVAADLAERSGSIKYPAVHVYCEKIANQLTEKFRSFSGKVHMAIEVRHSQDRLEGLQDALELYADAATGATVCFTAAGTRCRSGPSRTGEGISSRWLR